MYVYIYIYIYIYVCIHRYTSPAVSALGAASLSQRHINGVASNNKYNSDNAAERFW